MKKRTCGQSVVKEKHSPLILSITSGSKVLTYFIKSNPNIRYTNLVIKDTVKSLSVTLDINITQIDSFISKQV